jgi:hypothetical protein
LTVLDDLTIARGDEGSGGADDPREGLHGGSGETRTACTEYDPGWSGEKHRDDIDTAKNAMKLEIALAKSRGKLDGTAQQSDEPEEHMWDQKMTVRDDLQTVGVVHGIVGEK